MIAKGAVLGNIRAAVGPCIGQQSYEVDDCFRQQFTRRDAVFEKYFINSANAGHYMFDLERFCGDRLKDGAGHLCAGKRLLQLSALYASRLDKGAKVFSGGVVGNKTLALWAKTA